MDELERVAKVSANDYTFLFPDGRERVLAVCNLVCSEFSGIEPYSSIPRKAAALLYHLVLDHLFVDGDKRFAVALAEVFLAKNGFTWLASDEDYVRVPVAIADINTRPTIEAICEYVENTVRRNATARDPDHHSE